MSRRRETLLDVGRWLLMSCPTLKAWLAADGRGLVAAPRCPAGGRIKGRAGFCACVRRFGWVTSACTCLQTHMHTNIHTGHQLHLSLTWESLMTEAGKPKKKPPRSPPPPSFFFPLSLSLFTARSDINAPYVRTFSNSVWHAINKTSRHTHTSSPSVHCVIWHGGWNEQSEYNIYSTSRTQGNEISSRRRPTPVDEWTHTWCVLYL